MSWNNLEDTSFIWSALGSEHAYWQRGYDLFQILSVSLRQRGNGEIQHVVALGP